ncbi:MAG: D-glycero-alpha-D-manno-heptose-1,7-bisphosphate 7-phosphatase, partial [Cetobacterium sp.]
MRKVIFLDRDGTINVEKSYLHKWEDFEFEKNAIEGLKKLKDLGYEFIVVTNQSGIGRGYYTEEDLVTLNNQMTEKLKEFGIEILECFYCPHHPEKGIGKYKVDCNCR